MQTTCARCGKVNRFPAAKTNQRAHCGSCKSLILPLQRPQEIRSAHELDELLTSSPLPVVVDFWAAWCGPCRSVAPEIERLARDRAGAVVVAKVDTEKLPEIAGRHAIRGIPTFVAFRGGRESTRTSGAMPAAAIADALRV